MPITKRDYLQFVEDSEAGQQPRPIDPLVRQAAVKAELLVGDSKWDTFLSQLQATRDVDEQELRRFQELLEGAWGKDVVVCQVNIATRKARIALMDDVMQLPSKIVRAAHDTQP